MNSTTVLLIALTLALLLIAAFYGLSDTVIDSGGEAIDNLSDPTRDEDDNVQFSSEEPDSRQNNEYFDVRQVVI